MYVVVWSVLDGCTGRTVARPDVLAQATKPRPSKTPSRSGDRGVPKQGRVGV